VLCFGRFPIRQQSCSRHLACVVAARAIVLRGRFVARVVINYWAKIVVFGTVTSAGIVMDTDDLERPSASVRRVDTICVKN
jgi:hypothetical protein